MNALQAYFGPKGQGGQAAVFLAITMMAMLFAVGLAIDAGQLFAAKRGMQEAADAAAFAGAVVIFQGGADPISGARSDGIINGFTGGCALSTAGACTDNPTKTTVTVNRPPASGAYAGNNKYVEVIITRQVQTSLVPAEAAFNPVTARSVAGADPIKSPYAIFLTKTTGPCLTSDNGATASLNVPNGADLGGIVMANCSGQSMDLQGSGQITDNLGFRTVGTVSGAGRLSGGLTTGVSKEPDPFAGFPKPAVGTIISNSQYSVPAAACTTTPLSPGVYKGGIINNNNCNVKLNPGVYILAGGGFNQNANSGDITSNSGGVLIFNTHSKYADTPSTPTGSCGPIDAQQGGGFDLTAQTTGTYAGMVFYQDPVCTNQIAVQSNGHFYFRGTVYAPTATVSINSQSPMTLYSQLVCSAISLQGNAALTVNYQPSASADSGLPTIVE
jgi:Flp pilus assembly protein TadG